MSDWAARRERIWAAVRDVPPGSVASYGQVAACAGIPRGARQVGRALKELPAGSDVPWFRIVRASGHLAFPDGSRAYSRQRKQLRAEGVAVAQGKVEMARCRWQPDLDELLWKPSASWD